MTRMQFSSFHIFICFINANHKLEYVNADSGLESLTADGIKLTSDK